MSSAFRRTLPARPDLEQQKRQAKELLDAFRRRDPQAHARVRAELPDKARIVLADAQYVIAREYGFPSWPALREHIETRAAEERPAIERFKAAVQEADAKTVRRLLERHEELRASINEPVFSFDAPAIVAASAPSTLRRSSGSVFDGRTLNHQNGSLSAVMPVTVSPSSSSNSARPVNASTTRV